MTDRSEYFIKYRLENKEKISAWHKENYIKNKEELDKKNADYYSEHKKEKAEYYQNNIEERKKYNSKNRKRDNDTLKQWRENNKGKRAIQSIRSHNKRKLRIPKWQTKEQKKAIELFYKNCPKDMLVDHIIPLCGKTISGLHILENLQYLTPLENSKKNDKFPYYPVEFYIKKCLLPEGYKF